MSLVGTHAAEALHRGLRMSADDYFRLEDDGFRYELVDGVVTMSPSPTPEHQKVAARLAGQLASYLDDHPVGEVYVELDVHLGQGPNGGDLVYRPDVVFIGAERAALTSGRVTVVPDLIVEIISQTSRQYDTRTKKTDYERAGVLEYWLVDPAHRKTVFFRLQNGAYREIKPIGGRFASEAVPGFELDIAKLERSFR